MSIIFLNHINIFLFHEQWASLQVGFNIVWIIFHSAHSICCMMFEDSTCCHELIEGFDKDFLAFISSNASINMVYFPSLALIWAVSNYVAFANCNDACNPPKYYMISFINVVL